VKDSKAVFDEASFFEVLMLPPETSLGRSDEEGSEVAV
jgi:hypothetical protein